MSPTHRVSSRVSGPKTRRMRSTALASAFGSAMVVLRHRLGQRPARPAWTIRRATRFLAQWIPSRRSWAWILGAP